MRVLVYTESLGTGRARGLVPQTPYLQSFRMEDYLTGDRQY